ncbi:MAG: PAS domain-containing protein [Thermodesulfobacteriota bacterium]
MLDQETIKQQYEKILDHFFQMKMEKSFFEVAELGKKLVLAKAGPEIFIEIHTQALKKMIGRLTDPLTISRNVVNANELLLNGIMSYAMTYYGFMDELEIERRNMVDARQKALEERDKLDEIVSAIEADLLLIDRDLNIIWINRRLREKRADAGKDGMVGKMCYQAYCNLNRAPEDCPATLAFKSGSVVRQEHPIVHPDGSVRHCYFTCSPLKNEKGRVTQALELVQDISERKRLEENLALKAKDLEQKNTELANFNKLFVDRELKMVELKEKIKELEARRG